jgi:hypothetical protein
MLSNVRVSPAGFGDIYETTNYDGLVKPNPASGTFFSTPPRGESGLDVDSKQMVLNLIGVFLYFYPPQGGTEPNDMFWNLSTKPLDMLT